MTSIVCAVDTGKENVYLLFDCGENVLHDLKIQ